MKNEIEAIMWYTGCTRKEAKEIINRDIKGQQKWIDLIVEAYEENSKKSFYND